MSLRNHVCHHLTYSVGSSFWDHQQGGDYIAGFSVSTHFLVPLFMSNIFFPIAAKVQDYFSTTEFEVENENADTHWKGATTSCVGSVRNLIFNAEHWSTFFSPRLRLYHLPNLMCLLTKVRGNCRCGDWFYDNADPCLSEPGLRPTVCFCAKRCPLLQSFGLCCKADK